jgi:hypothetical protein
MALITALPLPLQKEIPYRQYVIAIEVTQGGIYSQGMKMDICRWNRQRTFTMYC